MVRKNDLYNMQITSLYKNIPFFSRLIGTVDVPLKQLLGGQNSLELTLTLNDANKRPLDVSKTETYLCNILKENIMFCLYQT